MKLKFTVLLLRPDYIANEFGKDTWRSEVEATDPGAAVVQAQQEAAAADHNDDPDDYHPLFVVEGHVQDLTPEPWR